MVNKIHPEEKGIHILNILLREYNSSHREVYGTHNGQIAL